MALLGSKLPLCIAGCLFVMAGGIWAANGSVSIKYDDLERMVLSRNGYVQQNLRLIDSAVARTGSLRRSHLPQISASVGGEGFQSGGVDGLRFQPIGSVDAVIPLYRGTENESEELIRRVNVNLAKNQLNRTTGSN
jgi:outer membrane protein TolC